VASGPSAVTLRAIAREMGMTAPGLYRYVASHEDLISMLIAALFDELTAELEAARDAADPSDVVHRVLATARAFRAWSLAHPGELGLVFGSPVPNYEAAADGITDEAGNRFGGVFLGLFVEVWSSQPFPVRSDDEIDPGLLDELRRWALPQADLPLGALELFLRCWIRLYGTVVMEAFGQLSFAVLDGEPLFEVELASLCELIGIAYRPPT
jgi:AcrR family transcriptional regulator